ncbi:leucine-rich repeat domain-containing protein [Microcoleus sp. D3_18_C4]
MSEQRPNESMIFSRFADWYRHIDSLSEDAKCTVKMLLRKAGTDDAQEAEQILSSMTELDLNNNRITDFSFLGSLTNLTTLHLDCNQITDIGFLGSLTNLTTLHLDCNQITDISFLGSLTNLTTLSLCGNQITDISLLGSFTNLTKLDLGYNQITDISLLGSFTNLTTLSLSYNQITDISFLGSLTNLTTLNLSNNRITDISFLGSLTNLTTLNLSNNRITDFSFLGSLTNLTTLNLSYNQITDFSFLGSLTNLTTLDLDRNQITDIRFLGSLTNLTTLHLNNNQITDFSFLGSLTNLTTLSLSRNQITDIRFLGSLTNLTTLSLNDNQITDIRFLGSLTNLTTLYLCSNQITDFSVLRKLTNLTKLDLRANRITAMCVLGELAQKRLTLLTRPIDAQKATEAVKVAYAAIGLEEPSVIICSSPRDAFLQIFNLAKGDHSPNWSNEGHGNRLGKKLDWKWMSMSPSIVRDFTSPAVWEYELLSMTMESEADSTLNSLMYELVEEYERSERMMGNVFPAYLFGLTYPETPTNLFEEIYLTQWYISSLGVNISQKAQEILRCQKLLFEHCGWIFPFEKICAVCDRPRHLRFDRQNRLHAEAEPAIEFADGWNFYYYHGVKLPEEYGKVHPNQWQAQWLLAEENAELRRVLIEAIGYDRICQELSAQQIDSWQEYALLQIDNADVEPICLLKMTCPSTGFIHALRVPPNLTSAREAIRWANWDIDPQEFSVQT